MITVLHCTEAWGARQTRAKAPCDGDGDDHRVADFYVCYHVVFAAQKLVIIDDHVCDEDYDLGSDRDDQQTWPLRAK